MGLTGIDTEVSWVIGHRGACGYAPENTRASLRMAAELGVQWVEFDVQLTADSQPILFHDTTLERTSNGRGEVSQFTLKELKTLDVGSWYDPRFADERIATLEDALEILAGKNIGAMIELKPFPGQEARTGEIVARYVKNNRPRPAQTPVLISFSEESLLSAIEIVPETPIGLNVSQVPHDWQKRLARVGGSSLHCRHQELTKARAEEIIQTGTTLRCFTVNTARRARTLKSWGVHGIFSDFPDRMLEPI